MSRESRAELDRSFSRLAEQLPPAGARMIERLRKPGASFARIPLGVVLVLAGFVGFLPVLGFWMVPLGLVLLAQDVPLLHGPLARLIDWIANKVESWRGKKHTRR